MCKFKYNLWCQMQYGWDNWIMSRPLAKNACEKYQSQMRRVKN